MSSSNPQEPARGHHSLDRRDFLKSTGAAAGGSLLLSAENQAAAAPLTEKEKQARLASNTWPIRFIFKTRNTRPNPTAEAMKKKYGEITMLDFPQFTKETFPGVYHMDLFSGLFGDFTDDSMYTATAVTFNGNSRTVHEFDPSSASGKKWLEKMAAVMAQHRNQVPPHFEQCSPGHLGSR